MIILLLHICISGLKRLLWVLCWLRPRDPCWCFHLQNYTAVAVCQNCGNHYNLVLIILNTHFMLVAQLIQFNSSGLKKHLLPPQEKTGTVKTWSQRKSRQKSWIPKFYFVLSALIGSWSLSSRSPQDICGVKSPP